MPPGSFKASQKVRYLGDRSISRALPAICGEAKILAEERQHMILKTICNCADVRTGIDLKAVCDPVVIEDCVQLGCIESQPLLVPNIHRDGAVLLEISNVLIDEGQRGVGREFRHYLRLQNAVLRWQIRVKRRVLGIGCPRRCCCILCGGEARRLCREVSRRLGRSQPSSRWLSPAPLL